MDCIDRIVQELFVGREHVLRYKPNIQGQRVYDDIIYVGSRCGPTHNDPAALCHELAHMVEIDEWRMKSDNWGLKLPWVEVCGQFCIKPSATQMINRELRVCAYQNALHEYFGVNELIEETVASLCFMPDWVMVPYKTNCDESRLEWCLEKLKDYRKVYNLDSFFTEFKRRTE